MSRFRLQVFSLILAVSVFFVPTSSFANTTKEFIMSCTYGVLAGTLVGAATLAFEDQPGDNLNKVARGASLGLYAGILLGVYVVYIVPDGESDSEDPGLPPEEGRLRKMEPPLLIAPIFNNEGVDGAMAYAQVYNF